MERNLYNVNKFYFLDKKLNMFTWRNPFLKTSTHHVNCALKWMNVPI